MLGGGAHAALDGTAALIARRLHKAPVPHSEKSRLRVAGKLHWLNITATDTWDGLHAKRGIKAIEVYGIVPKRLIVLVHDCRAPYWRLDSVHALCNTMSCAK